MEFEDIKMTFEKLGLEFYERYVSGPPFRI